MAFMTDKKAQRTVIKLGCDCGAIVQATLSSRVHSKGNKYNFKMNWSTDALKILDGIPLTHRLKLISIIEEKAKSNKRRKIDCDVFYDSKPPLDFLYPSILQYMCRPHNGKITTLQISKFDKTLYFSCGLDGKIYLFLPRTTLLLMKLIHRMLYQI